MSRISKNSNDSDTQRKIVFRVLQERGPEGVTTIELRELHDIMMPAARIHELRHDYGYNIQLISDFDTNAQGNKHRCGRYVLLSGKWQSGVAV